MPDCCCSCGSSGRSARPMRPPSADGAVALLATLSSLRAREAVMSTLWPWRQTSIASLSPGCESPTMAGRSPEEMIWWPFAERITSPGLRPARSAGLPFSTLATSAPAGRSRPKESASAWFTSCTATPSLACSTLPCATIWSLILVARSIGMENDTPW